MDDTSPNKSTTSTKLDFAEELNDEDCEKVAAAEKEISQNVIVGGVVAAAAAASGGGVNLFGKWYCIVFVLHLMYIFCCVE